MISTAPGFLGKPYLPGYIFNNIPFPTFSVIINYSKRGDGQQPCNHSGNFYEQHGGWEARGPWGFYFSGSGIHITSHFNSDFFHLN